MPGTNTCKEHLQFNEKERNIKNLVFDPRQLFKASKKFLDPRHPSHFFRSSPLTLPTLPTLFSRLAYKGSINKRCWWNIYRGDDWSFKM